MFGIKLAINEYPAIFPRLLDQIGHRYFGSVRSSVEHGFRKEDPADPHPVQSADKRIALPDLNGTGVFQFEQTPVGGNHFRRNPRPFLPVSAGGHHLGKRFIFADPEDIPSYATSQSVRAMKGSGKQHHARVGAPP